ncbi:DUF6691 family protein [Derxia gummosa]|uniref:DUF6691 family protein n=1 Tax=Derxia gummosa DSM 723 TaxID=1121388 RepID=A0A8B6X3P7_9BURK|nr:DUF6691 family protein [Derxia gummosa]
MLRLLTSLAAGLLFGAGLAIGHMTDPLKVLAFLDIAGEWDPSLAFVMGGAVLVAGIGFRRVLGAPSPRLDTRFHLPPARRVDPRLVTGAALFGLGWGLTGYCPGPALAGLVLDNRETWLFVPAMFAGGLVARRLAR